MSANGRLPVTQLRSVGTGCLLLNPVAFAFRLVQHIGKLEGVQVVPASEYGAGYRDIACQRVFYDGSHGNRADAEKANLNPNSHVSVAAPGNSSHGTGTRIDVLFNGSAQPTKDQLALMARYGFTREFGADDPNHFMHSGRSVAVSESDKMRIVAHYLNTRKLGDHTTTQDDGIPGKHFITLLQTAGNKDGLYRVPPYRIDGDWNPTARTRTYNVLLPHYWDLLWK